MEKISFFMTKSEWIGNLERTIGRKTKITLKDRFSNYWENLKDNKEFFISLGLTVALGTASYFLIKETTETSKATEGLHNSLSFIGGLENVLRGVKNAGVNFPVSSEMLTPASQLISQSYTGEFAKQAKELVQGINSIGSTFNNHLTLSESINNLTFMRELISSFTSQYHETLKMVGAFIGGCVTVISGFVSFMYLWENDFTNNNSTKKDARGEYKKFRKDLLTKLQEKKIKEEDCIKIGEFFSQLSKENSYSETLMNAMQSFKAHNYFSYEPELNAVLSSSPDKYVSRLEKIYSTYFTFKRQDKERAEFFLDSLRNIPFESLDSLISLTGDIFDYVKDKRLNSSNLKVISSSKKTCKETIEAVKFWTGHYPEQLPQEIREDIASYYLLSNDQLPKLKNVSLDNFSGYVKEKYKQLSKLEFITLLNKISELEGFIDSECQNMNHGKLSLFFGNGDISALDSLLENYKLNPRIVISALDYLYSHKDEKEKNPIKILKNTARIYDFGFQPAEYLIQRLDESENPDEELEAWKQEAGKIKDGGFNPNDELHIWLEYSKYVEYKNGNVKECFQNPKYYEKLFEGAKQ